MFIFTKKDAKYFFISKGILFQKKMKQKTKTFRNLSRVAICVVTPFCTGEEWNLINNTLRCFFQQILNYETLNHFIFSSVKKYVV